MRKYLDKPKIKYLIEHLKLRCNLSDQVLDRFIFLKEDDLRNIPSNRIVFPLSKQAHAQDIRINGLPILYPIYKDKTVHYFTNNNSTIFSHDILKAIFCLQTLFYEQNITKRDKLGRIPAEDTLNFKMNFLNKPIVDYLFDIIIDAISEYCLSNSIHFERKALLSEHTLLLSHDVDRVETYSLYNLLNSLKLLSQKPSFSNMSNVTRHLKQYFLFNKRENPLWDFPEMREVEKGLGLKSTYYFLNQGKLHQDAYYKLSSPRILKLINTIQEDDNEIGIHLTIAGNQNETIVRDNLKRLNSITNHKVIGARSHWLRFESLRTPDILEALGLKYDSSIAHFSQPGFRAGTCLPYKLYSFNQNRLLNIWEIPLIYMDCQLLDYQAISQDEAIDNLYNLLTEVIKFKGVYTLLWHNGNLAKEEPFSRRVFYKELLKMIMSSGAKNMTAKSLIKKIEESN